MPTGRFVPFDSDLPIASVLLTRPAVRPVTVTVEPVTVTVMPVTVQKRDFVDDDDSGNPSKCIYKNPELQGCNSSSATSATT